MNEENVVSKIWGLIAVGGAATVAVLAIAMYIGGYFSRPDENDWAVLDSEIRKSFVPTKEAIAVVPFWAERGLEYFGDLEPYYVRDVSTRDLDAYERLHIVYVFGREAELADKLSATFASESVKKIGKLIYETLKRKGRAAETVYDFYERFDEAKAYLVSAGANTEECPRKGQDTLDCGRQRWKKVTPKIAHIDREPYKCIWAHPQTGKELVIYWENVPTAQRLTLHAGLTVEAVGMGGAPVKIEALVDGRPVGGLDVENKNGWFRMDVGMRDLKTGGGGEEEGEFKHTVAFKITTAKDGMRHFCFHAVLRDYVFDKEKEHRL